MQQENASLNVSSFECKDEIDYLKNKIDSLEIVITDLKEKSKVTTHLSEQDYDTYKGSF